MKRIISIIAACAFVLGATGCARTPSPKSAQHKIKSFFVKYGKDYPTTEYGRNPVKEAEVGTMEEIHKNLVGTEAIITLGNGDLQKVAVTFAKRAWWKIVSWERLL